MDEENLENAKVLNGLIDKLMHISIETCYFLVIMVACSFDDMLRRCMVPLHELGTCLDGNLLKEDKMKIIFVRHEEDDSKYRGGWSDLDLIEDKKSNVYSLLYIKRVGNTNNKK